MTRQYASLLPLDVGFDLRVTKHSVRLSTLPLRYLDQGGRQQVTSPDPESAADVLARAGYSVVAFLTANGRDVQCTPANDAPPGATVDVDPDATPGFTWTGPVWSVQARQDNYWCNGPSLVSALERPVGPSPTCDPSVSRRQCKRLAHARAFPRWPSWLRRQRLSGQRGSIAALSMAESVPARHTIPGERSPGPTADEEDGK